MIFLHYQVYFFLFIYIIYITTVINIKITNPNISGFFDKSFHKSLILSAIYIEKIK